MSNIHRATLRAVLQFPYFVCCTPFVVRAEVVFPWRHSLIDDPFLVSIRSDVLKHDYGRPAPIQSFDGQCEWITTGFNPVREIHQILHPLLKHRRACAVDFSQKYHQKEA